MKTTDPAAPPPPTAGPTWAQALALPLACAGALVGAALGVAVVVLAVRAGYYAMLAVGVLAGLGASPFTRRGQWPVALPVSLLVGCIALAVSLWTEWWLFPFRDDGSLGFFISHLGSLPTFSLIMHFLGAALAGYIAYRR